ncbi:hypothetical protein BS17DRAFT_778257 [Gyrodon lividus]|nr:hypothetical protein BS17DRAFT_778257 [Gyrodon lividus]
MRKRTVFDPTSDSQLTPQRHYLRRVCSKVTGGHQIYPQSIYGDPTSQISVRTVLQFAWWAEDLIWI